MKIIVTGALGHIGSRLIRELPRIFSKATIVMLDNLATLRYCSLFDLPNEATYRFFEVDVTTADLSTWMDGADVVIHLAALTDAASSFTNRENIERVNFNATKQVAQSCRIHQVPMIHLSSTSVYGTQEKRVDENCTRDELQPQSPYAESKLREEEYLLELSRKFSTFKYVVFRFGTIAGASPGMRFHTAVNKFCWQAAMGESITVWRTAYDQKRPYLDLSDAVHAIAFAIEKRIFDNSVYNVLTNNLTVREIIEYIHIHIPSISIKYVDSQIMNQLSYEVSNQKIKNIGFTLSGNIEHAIKNTIELIGNASGYCHDATR